MKPCWHNNLGINVTRKRNGLFIIILDGSAAEQQQYGEGLSVRNVKWSPLRQEPETPFNNATSRGLWRITPGRSRGIASRGIQRGAA
jgi:hypothetical protein